jgi:hypothetical protein
MNGLARHLIKPRLTDGFGEKKENKHVSQKHKSYEDDGQALWGLGLRLLLFQ